MALKQVSGATVNWEVDADDWDASEFTNGLKTVRFRLNKNALVRYIRTWILQINDATWINITGKLYLDEAGERGDLIASSSTTHAKGDIFTLKEGAADLPFQFADLALNGATWYHFALSGTGYSPTASSFLAWKKSYPDPVYQTGLGISFGNRPDFPYDFVVIGADF